MDVFHSLAEEHRRVTRLLDQLLHADDAESRQQQLADLGQELEIHARLEKELFYPALRQGDGIDPMIEESLSEHEVMLSLCAGLEERDPAQWTADLERIKGHMDHHVHEEENHLFPKARSAVSSEQQDQLARQLDELRDRFLEAGPRPSGETAESVRQQADEFAGRVSDRTGEFARMARERGRAALLEGSRSAAQRTDSFADALHETGENLGRHGHSTLSQYLVDAADELGRFSKRLDEGDIDRMVRQARTVADRNPSALFGGAIVAGFLVTRFFKSSEDGAARPDPGGAGERTPDAAAVAGEQAPEPSSQPQSEEAR